MSAPEIATYENNEFFYTYLMNQRYKRAIRTHGHPQCSRSLLEKKEHNYIHGYNTLYPIGLNKINPFGIPRLSV